MLECLQISFIIFQASSFLIWVRVHNFVFIYLWIEIWVFFFLHPWTFISDVLFTWKRSFSTSLYLFINSFLQCLGSSNYFLGLRRLLHFFIFFPKFRDTVFFLKVKILECRTCIMNILLYLIFFLIVWQFYHWWTI